MSFTIRKKFAFVLVLSLFASSVTTLRPTIEEDKKSVKRWGYGALGSVCVASIFGILTLKAEDDGGHLLGSFSKWFCCLGLFGSIGSASVCSYKVYEIISGNSSLIGEILFQKKKNKETEKKLSDLKT